MQRYLLISNELRKHECVPVFVILEKGAVEVLEQERSVLGLDFDIQLSDFNRLLSEVAQLEKLGTTPTFQAPRPDKIFLPQERSLQIGDKADLHRLVEAIGFAKDYFFERDLSLYVNSFVVNLKAAKGLLDAFKPAAVVFDIEYIPAISSIIFSANEQSIPIFSLQHAIGYGPEYSRLPVVADYYFAYSKNNCDTLSKMGVSENSILFTGAPEKGGYEDIENSSSLRNSIRKSLGINGNDKVILLGLKSCEETVLEFQLQDNVELLQTVAEIFCDISGWFVLVRRHPRDKSTTNPDLGKIFDGLNLKFNFVNVRHSIEHYLFASDYFVQFLSGATIEAMECDVPTCAINRDDGVRFPDWGKYNTFRTIEVHQTRSFLTEMKEGRWPATDLIPREARQRFLEEFSLNKNTDNAKKIAREITNILSS